MRILYICSKKFDYQQDLIYSGLVKAHGKENIIEYPWNPNYHLPLKEYPKNMGYTSFSLKGFFSPDLANCDVAILASAKEDALDAYIKILPQIKNKLLVFIDGGDWSKIGSDFYRLGSADKYEAAVKQRPFDIVLKREYMTALHETEKNVYPFPFSFPYNVHVDTVSENEKKYDVSFWGHQKEPVREKALTMLQGKYDCEENGTVLNQNFEKYKRKGLFYLKELASCKVILNFKGGGWDTMRYWEAPAAGAFMISQKPQIVIPNNFEEGKHVIWCDDSLDDMIDKIDHYLQRPEERIAMATSAKKHLETYHLNTVRAQQLLEIIQKS